MSEFEFDLVVKNGLVATEAQSGIADIGIRDGVVAAIGQGLTRAASVIDASGKIVFPGGVESHCHIEQLSSYGLMGADDFYSGTVSAAFGGNTTIIPFAAQHRGMKIPQVLEDYHRRAREKAVIDYSFHLIVTDVTDDVLNRDLAAAFQSGVRSVKLYLTYDLMKVSDEDFLEVLSVCRREGALAMVHAENNAMIKWLTRRLIEKGHTAPRYHAVSHPRIGEGEASRRAIDLATLADTPLLIVHVSCREAVEAIASAQSRGLPIFGESCPQYLFLEGKDLDLPGLEGAKLCCSPPPRGPDDQRAIWTALINGTLEVYSSDHAPYRMDESGKFARGSNPDFKNIANGIPGIEVRLPLLFSEGVRTGRIDLAQFVRLSAANASRLYGLWPKKGTIAVGSDADLAIWEPERRVTIRAADLHDAVGYSPYEGREVVGWPQTVVNRGRIAIAEGKLNVARGSGQFVPRGPSNFKLPLKHQVPETDPCHNFGADVLGPRPVSST